MHECHACTHFSTVECGGRTGFEDLVLDLCEERRHVRHLCAVAVAVAGAHAQPVASRPEGRLAVQLGVDAHARHRNDHELLKGVVEDAGGHPARERLEVGRRGVGEQLLEEAARAGAADDGARSSVKQVEQACAGRAARRRLRTQRCTASRLSAVLPWARSPEVLLLHIGPDQAYVFLNRLPN